eukprot:g28551.t1
MASQTAQVQLGLLSGRTVRCDPEPSRTVRDLLEEAQSKLGTGIHHLVTSSGTTLKEHFSLKEAGIDYTSFVTAIASESRCVPVVNDEECQKSVLHKVRLRLLRQCREDISELLEPLGLGATWNELFC